MMNRLIAYLLFVTESVMQLFDLSQFETVQCEYLHRITTNRKEGISVPRVFVQGRWRKI